MGRFKYELTGAHTDESLPGMTCYQRAVINDAGVEVFLVPPCIVQIENGEEVPWHMLATHVYRETLESFQPPLIREDGAQGWPTDLILSTHIQKLRLTTVLGVVEVGLIDGGRGWHGGFSLANGLTCWGLYDRPGHRMHAWPPNSNKVTDLSQSAFSALESFLDSKFPATQQDNEGKTASSKKKSKKRPGLTQKPRLKKQRVNTKSGPSQESNTDPTTTCTQSPPAKIKIEIPNMDIRDTCSEEGKEQLVCGTPKREVSENGREEVKLASENHDKQEVTSGSFSGHKEEPGNNDTTSEVASNETQLENSYLCPSQGDPGKSIECTHPGETVVSVKAEAQTHTDSDYANMHSDTVSHTNPNAEIGEQTQNSDVSEDAHTTGTCTRPEPTLSPTLAPTTPHLLPHKHSSKESLTHTPTPHDSPHSPKLDRTTFTNLDPTPPLQSDSNSLPIPPEPTRYPLLFSTDPNEPEPSINKHPDPTRYPHSGSNPTSRKPKPPKPLLPTPVSASRSGSLTQEPIRLPDFDPGQICFQSGPVYYSQPPVPSATVTEGRRLGSFSHSIRPESGPIHSSSICRYETDCPMQDSDFPPFFAHKETPAGLDSDPLPSVPVEIRSEVDLKSHDGNEKSIAQSNSASDGTGFDPHVVNADKTEVTSKGRWGARKRSQVATSVSAPRTYVKESELYLLYPHSLAIRMDRDLSHPVLRVFREYEGRRVRVRKADGGHERLEILVIEQGHTESDGFCYHHVTGKLSGPWINHKIHLGFKDGQVGPFTLTELLSLAE